MLFVLFFTFRDKSQNLWHSAQSVLLLYQISADLVVNIILDINLLVYLLSFFLLLSFFRKRIFSTSWNCNRNLFIKSITITGIF